MDLGRLQVIAILLGFLQSNAEATLPSVEFIVEFMAKHQRSSVTLHIPDSEKTTDCKNWYVIRNCMKEGHILTYICTHFRAKNVGHVPTAFRHHGLTNYESEPTTNDTTVNFIHEDLHIFIIDQDNLNQSLQTVSRLYSLRTRKSREFWLVDVSYWANNFPKGQLRNQIKRDFRNLPFDLDDDVYLYSGKFREVVI